MVILILGRGKVEAGQLAFATGGKCTGAIEGLQGRRGYFTCRYQQSQGHLAIQWVRATNSRTHIHSLPLDRLVPVSVRLRA